MRDSVSLDRHGGVTEDDGVHCRATVPAVTATVLSAAISWARLSAAATPSVTKEYGPPGCASTHLVGTRCVTTTTGRSNGCGPPQPSVKSNSVRPPRARPVMRSSRARTARPVATGGTSGPAWPSRRRRRRRRTVEQAPDLVVVLRDVPVQGHRGGRDDLPAENSSAPPP